MSYTDISLCSKALLRLGANPITSFEDGTAEAMISGNLYPIIRDSLLSSYPWSFAIMQKKLPLLDYTPVADFKYAYLLPQDFLRVISAGLSLKGSGLEYKIVEDKIHTNYENLTLTYIFRPHEVNFPAYFSDVLIYKLASELCIPLTESTSRSEFLNKKYNEEVSRARLTDAQQSTPKCFESFSLVEARR